MGTIQHGFDHAWESLLLDFEEVLVGNAAIDPGGRPGTLAYPVFDRPFSIVKLFHHPAAEMGLELRADGYNAVLSMFRHDPGADEMTDPEADGENPLGEIELGNVSANYDELLDMPDEVMARVLSFLPRG